MTINKIRETRLMQIMRTTGVRSKDLDSLVVSLAIKNARNINAGGLKKQLNFIISVIGMEDAIKTIGSLSTSTRLDCLLKKLSEQINTEIKEIQNGLKNERHR